MLYKEAMRDESLQTAIDKAGGPSGLAAKIGTEITRQAVSQWRRCPARRVIAVEAATGVSRHELRPDIYPREEAA